MSACRSMVFVQQVSWSWINTWRVFYVFLFFQLNLCTGAAFTHIHMENILVLTARVRWCSDIRTQVNFEKVFKKSSCKNKQFQMNEKAILQRGLSERKIKMHRDLLQGCVAPSRHPLLLWSVLSPNISSPSQPQVGPEEGCWILK